MDAVAASEVPVSALRQLSLTLVFSVQNCLQMIPLNMQHQIQSKTIKIEGSRRWNFGKVPTENNRVTLRNLPMH